MREQHFTKGMSLHNFFAAVWFASSTAAAVFHGRGSANYSAPYSNVTVLASLSLVAPSTDLPAVASSSRGPYLAGAQSSASDEYGYAHPTGARSSGSAISINSNTTQPVYNASIKPISPDSGSWTDATLLEPTRNSNASCTINIPSASIDYWYPATYSHPVGTITSQYANFSEAISYTLIPATMTFDVASALVSDFACTMAYSPLPGTDWTYTFCLKYSEKPTAASTSLVYRTAAAPFPPGGVIPMSDVGSYDIYVDMPLATRTVTIAPNSTVEQVSATPFVYFTAYEIEHASSTETVKLPSAHVYPYWVKDVQHEASASGSLPEGFMQQITQTDCDSGQLLATVEVLIVVDLYYVNLPNWNPNLIQFESTAIGWDDPPVNFNINNDGTTEGMPLTIDDWNLPGDVAQPTPHPNNRPSADSVQATAASNVNTNQRGPNGNDAQNQNVPQPTKVIVGSVGSLPVVIEPSSVIVIGSQTLQPGGPAVVVGGVTPISLVPSATAIIVGGSTTLLLPQVFDNPPPRPPPVLTIGSSTLTANAATQFLVAPGQTLTPGGTATVDGVVVSLAPSASFVVVGGSTQFFPVAGPEWTNVATQRPDIVIGGTTIVALPSANIPVGDQNNAKPGPSFVVEGQTLAPGGEAITVSGTTITLLSGGSSIVIDGVTSAVENPLVSNAQPSIVIGNSVFSPISGSGSAFVIAGQTLVPGGEPITVSGTVISLAPSASFVVVNGVTSTLANIAAAQDTAAPLITIGNSVFKPLPGTGITYLIGSSTLTPGGIITVAGTTISLAPGATAIVINGQTSFLTPGTQNTLTNAPLLTVGSQTYTAVSGTTYVVDGQTLTPGGTIVVGGTTISLAPGATQLIYGSSGRSTTTALFPATTTPSQRMTGTAAASARPNGSDGQAAATSQKTGSESILRVDCSFLFFVLLALSL
ncbi:hypothetical protein HBI70_215880 [Parastagonospora nodorum]|nr:hypothetical protein HBI10_153750 [Parastagonospora nodorum]KAH4429545.1 hypothetical protein HBH99_004290 [Parastagonospora nodorum]KAH5248833.1 hypothetical protein HBI70_215880 [Parastagonospora nodorum]KAH6039199.1 hypothetical protein HBI54_160130 [Parastagonospora nodorum]KAH6337263.1 hypothetical protein HBI37_132820 [Parastagonospora nodorum]